MSKTLKVEVDQLEAELESLIKRVAKTLDDLYGTEEPDIEKMDHATLALETAGKAQKMLESAGATSSEEIFGTVKELVAQATMHANEAEPSFPAE